MLFWLVFFCQFQKVVLDVDQALDWFLCLINLGEKKQLSEPGALLARGTNLSIPARYYFMHYREIKNIKK